MFLPNVPEATFIPGATSIPESRVHKLFTMKYFDISKEVILA